MLINTRARAHTVHAIHTQMLKARKETGRQGGRSERREKNYIQE